MIVEHRAGEIKTERIDNGEITPEKEKFEEFTNIYRNLLMNVSISIKTLEDLTNKKREKENKVFSEYCPAFLNTVFTNFWAQIVINLNEFFTGRDFCVRKFINYAKANWKSIFTGRWKETTTWSDGEIEEKIIFFNYNKVKERIERVEKLLESNKNVVEKIETLRDEVYAHIDKNPTYVKLKIEEVRHMFGVAEEIFNNIASLYDNIHRCLEPTNSDDVYNLVKCVNTYEEFKKEIRELRRKKIEEEFNKRFKNEK